MRYYNLDGTYQDYPLDNKFGWSFENISIDEAVPEFEAHNSNLRELSRAERLEARTASKDLRKNSLSNMSGSITSDLDKSWESDFKNSGSGLDYEVKISFWFLLLILLF